MEQAPSPLLGIHDVSQFILDNTKTDVCSLVVFLDSSVIIELKKKVEEVLFAALIRIGVHNVSSRENYGLSRNR